MSKQLVVLIILSFATHLEANTVSKDMPKKAAGSAAAESGGIIFNTHDIPSTDTRNDIKFSVPVTEEQKKDKTMADPVQSFKTDEPFKTYIGYPKHQFRADLQSVTVSSKFTYEGVDSNYKSGSSPGVGLMYRIVLTPQIDVGLNYSYYKAGVSAGILSGGSYTVSESEAKLTSYSASFNYYWIAGDSFLHRYGVGAELGYSSFPILDFDSGTNLILNDVKDFTIRASFNYQYPVLAGVLLKTGMGYKMGTGIGNTGNLTAEKNGTLDLTGGVEWALSEVSSIQGQVNYQMQKTEVEGDTAAGADRWETESSVTTLGLGYTHTF